VTEAIIDEFFEAWNRRDWSAFRSHLTDDCVFYPSVGPEPRGRTVAGVDAVVELAASLFEEAFPTGRYVDVSAFVAAERGAAGWALEWTDENGATQRIYGCDLFELRGDRISVLDGYRKAREG